MNPKLYRAAIKGDVTLLFDLLNEDEDVLDGVMLDPMANENPLHVAAQLGHVDFAKEILSRKPRYVHELNSHGKSPLHLATEKGHVDVVKLLLQKDATGVCFIRDKRGRTPLHIAARKGQVEVLKELVLVESAAAWILTDQGEPILHMCAKNNQFEALKVLIELVDDDEFVKMKDNDNNSILHLLAFKLQTEVISFLVSSTTLEINALNIDKNTPLDALLKAPKKSGYKKCKRILRGAGGKIGKELLQAQATNHRKNSWTEHANWLNETKSGLMVVAILIATVTFGAILNPPGGVWQDNFPPPKELGANETEYIQWVIRLQHMRHTAGQAIMSYEFPELYLIFNIFNQIGFLASASIILLLISGFNLQGRRLMWALMIAMWIAIGSMVVSFGVAFRSLTNSNAFFDSGHGNLYLPMVVLSIFGSVALIGPLVIAHLVRLVTRFVQKSRILKSNRRAGSTNEDTVAIQLSVDRNP